jgi:hypothetical protein
MQGVIGSIPIVSTKNTIAIAMVFFYPIYHPKTAHGIMPWAVVLFCQASLLNNSVKS